MQIRKTLLVTALIPLLFVSCAGRGKVVDFNKRLDTQIQVELDKRKKLVAGNPVYLGLVSELLKGRELLLGGKSKEAFLTFDGILQNERYTNFPEYSFAKYYLANALYDADIKYGALLYFVDIVQKEPLKIHTHESLRRAISIAQELKDDDLILYLASTITPDKVPLSLREEFRYFIAKDLYEKKNFSKAAELFQAIPHRNRLFLAAQYLLGAIAIQENNLKKAIEYYRNISNTRSPVVYYENLKIRQLSNLALGRLFYEEKNYPLSIVYYKKVEKDDDFYPSALYESSWALFKLHKFNESLSVLHTLNSPFFEQVYFLKSYLLRGAIYLELCHYEDAVTMLSGVEQNFIDLKTQIDRFARQAQSPQEYYPLLSSKVAYPGGREEFAYNALFQLSAGNRDFLGIHRYIRSLKKEQETLESMKSPRGELLSKLVRQKASDLILQASYVAGKKLLIARRLIEDFLDLKDILRYEIVSAERKILQTRSLRLAPPVLTDAELIRPEFTESLRETLTWWDFNGEYWEDELGAYLYELNTKCKDEGAATPK